MTTPQPRIETTLYASELDDLILAVDTRIEEYEGVTGEEECNTRMRMLRVRLTKMREHAR